MKTYIILLNNTISAVTTIHEVAQTYAMALKKANPKQDVKVQTMLMMTEVPTWANNTDRQ